jgi:hypothetical protein
MNEMKSAKADFEQCKPEVNSHVAELEHCNTLGVTRENKSLNHVMSIMTM